MKARVIKKLSKRLAALVPDLLKESWTDKEIMSESWEQGSRVSNCLFIGGHCDEWGEGTDSFSLWDYFTQHYCWMADCPSYPDGHRFEGLPDTSSLPKLTARTF